MILLLNMNEEEVAELSDEEVEEIYDNWVKQCQDHNVLDVRVLEPVNTKK